jgi:tetratricopeptide (TPR) repeat protein
MKQRVRIFVSSPADVQAAREIAALTIERLAQEFARFLKIEPYLWEFEAMVASGHFQDSIEPPSAFDIVVLIVWSRLGTVMPERTGVREYRGIDGRAPVTGTEWEFEEALQAAQKCGAPDLLVYRNNNPAPFDTRDPTLFERQSEQLKALNGFWERHFANQGMFIGAYTAFTSDAGFASALENHLRKLIERRIAALGSAAGDTADRAWTQAPFRGLEAYEFEHAPIFFGQDAALAKAMLQLMNNAENASPFLLVLGASGSGKSSLVKAGIVPKLFVPRRVAGTAFLRRVVFRPSDASEGEDLFDAFARRLTTPVSEQEGLSELIGHGQSVASLSAHLRNATTAPAYPIGTALGQLTVQARQSGRMLEYESARLVLVIDQLEELFTADRFAVKQRVQFIELLAGLVRSGCVWVVATMRMDFWHRANETPELIRLSEGSGRIELLPPGAAQLSQMIRRPAEAAGVGFEVHATTNVPLNDVIAEEVAHEPGALPLLSYLLDQLYRSDVSETNRHMLTYATYERLGGLKGAIATKAESVLERCAPEDRTALGSVLFSLVSKGSAEDDVDRAVARRVPLSKFAPGTPQRRLVEAFLDPNARLLVSNAERDADPTVRVAHEALISSWARAREYVKNNEEALRIRRRIEGRYARWRAIRDKKPITTQDTTEQSATEHTTRLGVWRARFGREQGLLSDIDIADGRRLLKDHRTDTESHLVDYIERSIAQDRRIRTRAVRILALVATVVTVLAIIALEQRNSARSETAIANRTTQFMVDMFENADPDKSRGDSITARKMLDTGADTIRSEPGLAKAPRVRAELQTAIGQAYTSLGLYPPAEVLLKQARADQAVTSIPDESRIRTLLASGTTLYYAGDDNQAAATYLQQAVDLARKHLKKSDPLRSQALTGLADLLTAEGEYVEAEKLCREALDADRQRGSTSEDKAVLANTLDSLGTTLLSKGDLAAAEAPMREALKLREEALGMNHPLRAESLNNLGVLLYQSGRYDEAIAEYNRALPIYEKVYDANHPEVAAILNNIGRSALMAGHIDAAEPLLRQSQTIAEKSEGEHHQDLVAPLNSLAMIDFYNGHLEAARNEIQRAESIARLQDHGELLDQVLINEASLELARDDRARASALLAESKALLQKAHPDTNADAWRYAVWDSVNAGLLAANGEEAKATRTLVAAQKVLDDRFGPNSLYSQLVRRQLLVVEKSSPDRKGS